MKWHKLGPLYSPSNLKSPKLLSHAANPTPFHLGGNAYRVFFCARDERNRSSVGAVDIDIVDRTILREFQRPFFEHGPSGTFYRDGVSIGNFYQVQGTFYLMFMGWQNVEGSHWRGDIGRLVLTPDLELKLDSVDPVVGADEIDPVSLSYPWIYRESENMYHMWYGSTVTWDAGNNEMLHILKYGYSKDGRSWIRTGEALPYQLGVAQAFSRPTVVTDLPDGHQMWFSYRSGSGESYRIGSAISKDLRTWSLKMEDGLDVSNSGWDSEMVEYPFVFRHSDSLYMLYNGNSHGKSGFGLARAEIS